MFLNKKYIVGFVFIMLLSSLNAYFYGKNKIQDEKIEWSVIESRHFDVHFVRGHDEFGKLTVLIAENAYYHLFNFFRRPLNGRIPIIVYSSKQEFQATNIIYPLLTEGIGGFTETLRNRVALPFDGSYKKFEEVLIHELVHAYINDLEGTVFRNPLMNAFSWNLPFWFSEGLPEYLALRGTDNHNNMYIIDMVINHQLRDLENLGGFFAYRLGEALLVWISENWDENRVVEFFYNVRIQSDIQTASRITFGFDFTELQKRFRLHLQRKYSHVLNEFHAPWENATLRHTDARETNAGLNIFPRFNSSGNDFVYFSSRRGRTVVMQGSTFGLYDDKVIMVGETRGRFEEFHFQRNNIAWFPDDRNIAFVSKTSRGDVIYFYDTSRQRIVQRLRFDEFDSIYEIDVSPDGLFLALAAQRDNRCDIYIYNIETKELLRITDDNYFSFSPRWSMDGTRVAFVSERLVNSSQRTIDEHVGVLSQSLEVTQESVVSERPNIFANLVKNIYYYDVNKKSIFQVTNDDFCNFYPVWTDNDERIMFISEEREIANIHIVDIVQNRRSVVTNVLSGVHSFDYSPANETLIFSTYYSNAWDIFSVLKPFENLSFYDYETNIEVEFINDFHEVFNTARYRFYGRIPRERMTRRERRNQVAVESEQELAESEQIRIDRVQDSQEENNEDRVQETVASPTSRRATDSRLFIPPPVNIANIRAAQIDYREPIIRNYRPRFGIDALWGGLAYSPSFGTIGMLQLGLSDLMGDHGIGINMEFNGTFEESNIVLSYMYLPHRIDYGFAVYNFSDVTMYRRRVQRSGARNQESNIGYQMPNIVHPQAVWDYLEFREYETGMYFLMRYPLSRFFRFDFEHQFYRYKYEWYQWNSIHGYWHRRTSNTDFVYVPQFGFVFDNALFGPTGPLTGYRLTSFIRHGFSQNDNGFTTLYSDFRTYSLISHRYAIANRLVLGISEGDRPERFNLTGFHGVRGFDDRSFRGDRKVLLTSELRYPFIDRLQMAFPLPLWLGNIRGSLFADVGTVWSGDDFRGMKDGRLNDIKLGFGFGPRVNLGFLILRLDVAWTSDFVEHSRPSFFLTINEDF